VLEREGGEPPSLACQHEVREDEERLRTGRLQLPDRCRRVGRQRHGFGDEAEPQPLRRLPGVRLERQIADLGVAKDADQPEARHHLLQELEPLGGQRRA
jgi:hypothetical protein